jgi:hypothetical protein
MSFRRFVRTLTVLLLMLALNGCGGGSGSGFNANESWGISLEVHSQVLPANLLDRDPCLGVTCFHTIQVDVTVTDHQGNAITHFDGDPLEVALSMGPGGHGYITRLNQDDDDRDEVDYFRGYVKVDDEWIKVHWHQLTAQAGAGGTARFFFTSTDNPGDVTLTASVTTPSGAAVTRKTNVTVGSTAGTGMPTQALIYGDPGVIFVQGLNEQSQSRMVALVFDEKMGAVADPDAGVNNVLIEIIDGPDAGEYLIGRNANGDIMRGNALLLATRNGKAEFELVSGTQSGVVGMRVTADGHDNNVDNVIESPVVGGAAVVVTTSGFGPPLAIVTSELPDSSVGDTYAALLGATGGTPPYTWALTHGSLPTGLGLDPTGVISGTTNWPGNFCFVVRVTDNTNLFPEQASRNFCIEVTGERPPTTLSITTSALPNACVGQSYARALGASGGEPPYSWSLDYTPPAGADSWLEISQSGIVFGTPEPGDDGIYQLGISVTDGEQERTRTIQLEVVDPCP